MRFEALLRLLTAYDTGRLTSFIGAGMSRPTCPDGPGAGLFFNLKRIQKTKLHWNDSVLFLAVRSLFRPTQNEHTLNEENLEPDSNNA